MKLLRRLNKLTIRELLDSFGKHVACSMDVDIRLQKAEKRNEGKFNYTELVRNLIYLGIGSKFNLSCNFYKT